MVTAFLACTISAGVITLATYSALFNSEMWIVVLAMFGLACLPASEWLYGARGRRARTR
jgi:hypothetical protein